MSRASPRRSRVSTGSVSALSLGLTPSSPWFDIRCASPGSRDKVAVGLTLTHHFLTIGVERIIDDPLSGILLVVILETQVAEACGDGLKAWPLGLIPERVVSIGVIAFFRTIFPAKPKKGPSGPIGCSF